MREKTFSLFLGGQIFLVLAGLLPLSLVAIIEATKYGIWPFMAWLVILYSSLRIAMYTVRGEQRIITMTFWVFVYIFLGLTPMLQLLAYRGEWEGGYTAETMGIAYATIFIGLFSYELGRLITAYERVPFVYYIKRMIVSRTIDPTRSALLGFLAVFITIFLLAKLGGLDILMLSRDQRFSAILEFAQGDSQAKFQMVSALLRVPVFVALILLITVWQNKERINLPKFDFNIHYKILLFVLLTINVLVNNPVNTPRYWFGTVVLSLVFLTLRWRSRSSFANWTAAIVLVLILVFPFADLFRYTTTPDIANLLRETTLSEQLIDKGDFDSFQQMLNAVEYTEQHGLAFGRQFLGTAMFWVPRTTWNNKPMASGMLVAEHKGYENTNRSMPLWGEAYLDGGFLGVILVFLVYGFLCSVLERLYLQRRIYGVNILLNVFVPVYAAYQFFILRGTLMSAFAYFVPVILIMLLASKKRALPIPMYRSIISRL